MRAQRALPSTYLVSGFAISMAVVAVLGSTTRSQAQVDPNLQTTVNTFSPPLVVQPPPTPTAEVGGECKYVPTPLERAQAKVAITSASISVAGDEFAKLLALKRGAKRALSEISTGELTSAAKCKARIRALGLGGTPIFNPKGQLTVVKVTFPFNPTYETNVLKSNLNVHSDTSAGFGGNVQVTGPGVEGRPFDLVGFGAGSASARYSAFPSKSFDAFTVQGFYQFFIDANGCYDVTWQYIDITPDTIKPPAKIPFQNMITFDTVVIGVQNQATFVPTYRREMADLLTPQVVFNRQNINLSGNSSCVSVLQPDQHSFCYYANLALAVGQTFSDVASLQNANLAAAATLGKRFDHTDFVLALTGTATARSFEDVPGGRQDLLLQIGPALAFVPNKCINASLTVTYNRNYSSVSAAAWSGLVVQPTLNIVFPVEPPPEKGHSFCG